MLDVSDLYWNDISDEDLQLTLKIHQLPEDTLVHASHCKIESGCKYLVSECPVVNGLVKQLFDYDEDWD